MRLRDGRAVPAFMSQALRNEDVTVFGDGTQTRSFCYVTDLVDGILRLMAADTNDPVNIGNPHEVTIEEIARTIIRLVGSTSTIVYRPLPVDDPKQRRPDITRARTLLGWEPKVGLEEGLLKTVDYFKPTALKCEVVAAEPDRIRITTGRLVDQPAQLEEVVGARDHGQRQRRARRTTSTTIDVSRRQLKNMTTTLVTMKVAVVSFPQIDGRNVRGPIARFTIATTPTMTMSRLITSTVSHSGRWLVSGISGQREHDERRHEQQLVGHRIEPRAEARALPGPARDQAVERVGHARHEERDQRGAEIVVDDEQHERRRQHDPQDRELVRKRQVAHGTNDRADDVERAGGERAQSIDGADCFGAGDAAPDFEAIAVEHRHDAGCDSDRGGRIAQDDPCQGR